jgi:hypothetical protein
VLALAMLAAFARASCAQDLPSVKGTVKEAPAYVTLVQIPYGQSRFAVTVRRSPQSDSTFPSLVAHVEVSVDGVNWNLLPVSDLSSTHRGSVTSITKPGNYTAVANSAHHLRVSVDKLKGGPIDVTLGTLQEKR